MMQTPLTPDKQEEAGAVAPASSLLFAILSHNIRLTAVQKTRRKVPV